LDGRIPDPSAPGEGGDGEIHLPPPSARHGHGGTPAAVSGSRGLHDARAGDDLLGRARPLRSGERVRRQLLGRIRGAVGREGLAPDVAAALERGVVPGEAVTLPVIPRSVAERATRDPVTVSEAGRYGIPRLRLGMTGVYFVSAAFTRSSAKRGSSSEVP